MRVRSEFVKKNSLNSIFNSVDLSKHTLGLQISVGLLAATLCYHVHHHIQQRMKSSSNEIELLALRSNYMYGVTICMTRSPKGPDPFCTLSTWTSDYLTHCLLGTLSTWTCDYLTHCLLGVLSIWTIIITEASVGQR